ncbi:MAG: hypothetical protein ACPLXC_00190 [Candidatus Pacearchaeota archaeon]
MTEQKPEKAVAVDVKRVMPIFADHVLVANIIKAHTEDWKKKKHIKKEGYVTLIFIDTLTHQAVSRVVVSRGTAEALEKALGESLEKFDRELKSKEVKGKTKVETTNVGKYLG